MKILRIKQPDGTTTDVPLGKGIDGKSAYQYAQEGGYSGTEAEFAERFAYLMGQSLVGNIDENNVITVMGELSVGTYVVKYENADGTKTDIGTITIGGGNDTNYTNILDNTTIELNTRLSSTFNQTKTGDAKATGVFTTDWIDLDLSAQSDPCYLYLRGCYWDVNTPQTKSTYLWYADANGASVEYQSYLANVETLDNGDTRIKIGYDKTNVKQSYYDRIKKIRISAAVSSSTITEADMENVIITINEPITD